MDAAAGARVVGSARVVIENYTFSPSKLEIAPGTTVTWVNQDDDPHTATSTEQRFDSGTLDTDQQYSNQFTQAGTYPYYCKVHPHMTATIVVR